MKREFPRYAVHIDFHTMPGIYDFGCDFNADLFAKTLKDTGVEYVNLFAKCNLGFCYFNTQIGTKYPSMKFDLFGEMLKACKKLDIGVSAYFNVGLSHEQALRHRDWCVVNKEGKVYDFKQMDHWFRTMCFQSEYKNYISSLVDELLNLYPEVDGLIFDSMNTPPCYGIECLEEMKKNHLDIHNPEDFQIQARKNMFDMQQALENVAKKHNPDLYRFYLGVPAINQPTHVEMEILPQGGWGYDYLPWYVRYIRTFQKPFSMMTGRFQRSWGDLAGLRPQAALDFDALYANSCGANISIGDHLHPRCQLNPAVYQSVKKTFDRIKALECWSKNATPYSDILVVMPQLGFSGAGDKIYNTMRGWGRMLCELKMQYDVTHGDVDFAPYKLIILPDYAELSSDLIAKLNKFMANGGKIISSGLSGIDLKTQSFQLDGLNTCAVFNGIQNFNYTFTDDGENPLLSNYNSGISMQPKNNGVAHGRLFKSYFNFQSFDFEHENLYLPDEKLIDDSPLISDNKNQIYHFANFIGSDYYDYAQNQLRNLLGKIINTLLVTPICTARNLPSFATISLMRQPGRFMAHILNYVPEKRGRQMEIIEDELDAVDVELTIQLPSGFQAKNVCSAPDKTPLKFTQKNNSLKIFIPSLHGYHLTVIE